MPNFSRLATLGLTALTVAMTACGATPATPGAPAPPSRASSPTDDPTDTLSAVALPDEAFAPQLPQGHASVLRDPGAGFPAGSPLETAAVAGGLSLAYERFSESANAADSIDGCDVSLYRFPSDEAAAQFLAAFKASYAARATHTGAAVTVPGGTEYDIVGIAPNHSLSVIGLHHGVVFLIALSGTGVTSAMIGQAAKQQYDRL